MLCPKCGGNIADDAKFCPKCGAKISKEKPSQPQHQKAADSAHKKETPSSRDTGRQASQSNLKGSGNGAVAQDEKSLAPRVIAITVAFVVLIAVILVVLAVSMSNDSTANNKEDNSTVTSSQSVSTETVTDKTTTEKVTEKKDEEITEETNPEIENLKATLLEEKASLPDPDGRQIKKASKYRIDGSLASETEYYENGVIADVIEYDMDGYKETETKYNESGEVIEEHNYSTEDHNYYEYGEFGIISKTNYHGTDGSGSRLSDDDDIVKTLTNVKTGESYDVYMTARELYAYNENGNLTRIYYEINKSSAGTKYNSEEYVYDENNNLLEYYKNGSLAWEFTYDENNNMASAKVYNSGYVYTPYYMYTYDNDNNLVTEKTYNLDDLSLREWKEYIYDDDKLLIKENSHGSTDNLTSSTEYTYTFDKEGRELSSSSCTSNSSSSENSTIIQEYGYWDNGNLLLSYRDSYKPNCNYLEKQSIDYDKSYIVYWDNGNIAIKGTIDETDEDSSTNPTNKYDYFGNVTYEVDNPSSLTPIKYTHTYTYDESGNVLTESVVQTGSGGGRTDYTYENEYYG